MIETEKFTVADYIRAAFIGVTIASIPLLFLQVYDLNTRIDSLEDGISEQTTVVNSYFAQKQDYINALAEEIGKNYCLSKHGVFGDSWGHEYCIVNGVTYTRSGMNWITGDSVKTL